MSASPDLEDPSTREAVLAVVPKVAGGLSFVSSAWIAGNVLLDQRRRRKTYHRLLAALSLCDMVGSFSLFLSTWPIPPGPNLSWGKSYHLWARGNDATCAAQGVGIQWGLTSAVLNVALAAHYLLVIRYNYSERRLKRHEPWVGAVALLIGLAAAVPGIFLDIYGDTNLWCWIAPDFVRCAADGVTESDCLHRAFVYRWAFYYGPLWTCVALITALQTALLVTVWRVEARGARWRATAGARHSQAREVAVQAGWYVGAFYVAWLPYTALTLTGRWFTSDDGFVALLIVALCTPLQGFLNLFVYQRKKIAKSIVHLHQSMTKFGSWMFASLVMDGVEGGEEADTQDRLLDEIYAD